MGRAGGEREALQQEIEQLRSQAASVQAANDQATARAEDLQRWWGVTALLCGSRQCIA